MTVSNCPLMNVYRTQPTESKAIVDFFISNPVGKLIQGDANGSWLGGGSLRSLYSVSEKINDFDVFVNNDDTKNLMKQAAKDFGYSEVFACPEGKLFTYERTNCKKIQIIHLRNYKNAEDVISDFDFTCTRQVTDGTTLWRDTNAKEHIIEKRLVANTVTRPVSLLKRIGKYYGYGYILIGEDAEAIVTMIRDIPSEDLNTDYYVD